MATDSPQCDLDSEIEVNEQTNKNGDHVFDKHFIKSIHTSRQTNTESTHNEIIRKFIENFNFEMIGTGIRTLGTGVQILVYCQSVFIDSGSY